MLDEVIALCVTACAMTAIITYGRVVQSKAVKQLEDTARAWGARVDGMTSRLHEISSVAETARKHATGALEIANDAHKLAGEANTRASNLAFKVGGR
jgi:hypothetical protein